LGLPPAPGHNRAAARRASVAAARLDYYDVAELDESASPGGGTYDSPMVVERLIGTHNGDVDEVALAARYDVADSLGATDTEVLLSALATVPTEAKAIASVLANVWGRAALAWVDRSDPTALHLARTALSPLATARDWAGNFYWASNPRWFRLLDAKGAYGFRDVTLVREGTYLRVRGGLMAHVEAEVHFTAQARERDTFAAAAVWRGFDGADMRLDRARATHVVVGRARARTTPARPQPRRGVRGTGSRGTSGRRSRR